MKRGPDAQSAVALEIIDGRFAEVQDTNSVCDPCLTLAASVLHLRVVPITLFYLAVVPVLGRGGVCRWLWHCAYACIHLRLVWLLRVLPATSMIVI